MAKVRVYELAQEFGVANKELVAKVRGMGIDVRNHMSSVEPDDAQRIRRTLDKERVENREVRRLSSTVLRRRAKTGDGGRQAVVVPATSAAERAARPVEDAVAATPPVERRATEPRESKGDVAPPAVNLPVEVEEQAPVEVVAEVPAASSVGSVEPTVPAEQPVAATVDKVASGETDSLATSKKSAPTIRYAPGFEPGGKYAVKGSASRGVTRQAGAGGGAPAGDAQPLSAAEAARMMSPAQPKVVITDLDARRGARREVSRAELFKDRRFRQQRPTRRKKTTVTKKSGKKTEITTPAEHKRVIRLEGGIAVGEIARQMGVKSTEVLKKLWALGLTNVTINQTIDVDAAGLLSAEFGYEVEDVAFREDQVLQETQDRPEDLALRAPVVTVMGHVDHGKTSLLDAIRNTEVAAGEAGGITQHTGAYRVHTPSGVLVFLDTPGHEAFTQMRARGAQVTDVVVLVVAADDGVMPQTVEAIDHAKDAGVPIIVAVNKCDLPDANPDRVQNALSERGLVPEDWGGETQFVQVSAKTREGLDSLLEALVLQSELLELKANADKPAKATVIEAKLDRARGSMCTVLVQEGTLRVGDTVVVGPHLGKVRAMLDDRGQQIDAAPPSTPVEILGIGGVPRAGDALNAVADDKAARQLAEHRHNQARRRELAGASASRTYEDILGRIQSGESHELKLLVKADVHGSAEAVKESLNKLSTDKVSVNVISAGVGGIHETDVNLAKAADALIVGFNVRSAGKANQLAEREGVQIKTYDVIYEVLDDVKQLMQGLLPKERREKLTGRVEVRQTFTIPKLGVIAGCAVLDGKVTRASHLRLIRDSVKIYDGKVGSLRRFKDDVREVEKGYECGLSLDGYNDIKEGDLIEAYDVEEVAASL